MHVPGAVFGSDRLGARSLVVQLDTAETGQQIGALAVNQMASIELGGNLHGQIQPTPGLLEQSGLGNCTNEITAQPDEGADTSIEHTLASLDCIEALVLGRRETIALL